MHQIDQAPVPLPRKGQMHGVWITQPITGAIRTGCVGLDVTVSDTFSKNQEVL